jgi:RNA polymerase sigma-70 factor (ECF subfamily)
MDNLTLLRSVREPEDPSTDALIRGRAALVERMLGEPAPQRSRRGIRIAGLSALGAGALTAALVLTNVVGFAGWRGGAEPAAADVLHSAAVAAIETSDPVVGPGQYLLVATTAVNMTEGQTETVTASYLAIEKDELYIPADREDDWMWVRHPSEVYKTFGPDSEFVANLSGDERSDQDELLQAPAGAFYGGEPSLSFGDLDALPRNPVQLLNYIYRVTLGSGPSPDGEALVYIADRLRTGIVPADLRAAFYEAAARIPGVTITEGQATLDGRTGVAIGRDEGTSFRQEIIIDPATGLFIGERQVALSASMSAPAGTAIGWSAVTTSVADSAPQGGTVNGRFDVMGCISDGKGGAHCPAQ